MKARIEKKLSKKLAEILPFIFHHVWIDEEISVKAWKQGSRVSHVASVGGGCDEWGEGQDFFTVHEDFINQVMWHKPIFKPFPEGHEFEGMAMFNKNRMTGKYLIESAKKISKEQK